jgi:N-carbamoylputrescine amidase
MSSPVKKVRVAAVQMASEDGMVEANLERATGFAEQAAERGARLIIFPEFMPTGYRMTTEIWDAGEASDGPTVQWLMKNSKRLGVYLGTSFLEAVGEDFLNTFMLTDHQGRVAGKVRKQVPAAFEAFFNAGEAGPHVIETEFGRMGVGICYENTLAFLPKLMQQQNIDFLVQPHSNPKPQPGILFPKKSVGQHIQALGRLTSHYASILGVPAILTNKVGKWQTPLPYLPFMPQDSTFPGLTTIAEAGGKVLAQLDGSQEGILVEEISLDPARKVSTPPKTYGRWAVRLPWPERLFPLTEALGRRYYKRSDLRRQKAREISAGK